MASRRRSTGGGASCEGESDLQRVAERLLGTTELDPAPDDVRARDLLQVLDMLRKLQIRPEELAARWPIAASIADVGAAVDLITSAADGLVLAALAPARSDPTLWHRMQRARAVLLDLDGDQARRRAVLGHLRWAVDNFGPMLDSDGAQVDQHHLDAGWRIWATALRGSLAEVDSAFAALEVPFVLRLLLRTQPSIAVVKGGAGRIAPPMLAARLSVRVRAFGDDNEARAKKRFLEAERSAAG